MDYFYLYTILYGIDSRYDSIKGALIFIIHPMVNIIYIFENVNLCQACNFLLLFSTYMYKRANRNQLFNQISIYLPLIIKCKHSDSNK